MRFSDVLETLRRNDGDTLIANVPDSWAQGRTLFGGLQAALLVRAMRTLVADEAPLRVLQTSFVGPVPAGSMRLTAQVLRQGKSVTHVDARIVDEGGAVGCTALGVFGKGRASGIAIAPTWPAVAKTPEQSPRLPHVRGISPQFTRFVEQRWALGAMPYCGGPEPRTQIYLRYPDEPAVVTESLVIALADSIPSPALSILKKPVVASSMTWTLEMLIDDPAAANGDGYWLMDAEVTAGRDGYLSQTATLWSPDRRAVALSRQCAVVFD